MEWIELLQACCHILLLVLGGIYIYRGLFFLLGLFGTKRYPTAKRQHRYAVLIAARNEETVLGHLLDSIGAQDYPSELITTFVVADNCTDGTARVAERRGAVCYERNDPTRRTKGYALQFLMERIYEDYGKDAFEGFFVFDADNLLTADYVSRMNDAFDAGEKLTVGYRNTKNLSDNPISASYAFHWMRTARMENRGRCLLGLPVRLQGTGFLASAELLSDGWRYTGLTEDRALTCDAVADGTRIAYQHTAMFYDEQPVSLRVAWRQRLRWSKGNITVFKDTVWQLLGGIFRGRPKGWTKAQGRPALGPLRYRAACYDMLLYNLPAVLPITVLTVASAALGGVAGGYLVFVSAMVSMLLKPFSAIPQALLLLFTERKRMQRCKALRLIWLSIAFPLFSILGDLTTWAAVFCRVTWEPIPHKVALPLCDVSKDESAPKRQEAEV